jgi:hypothetical protein
MSVNWGNEPFRDEAIGAANAALGWMTEFTSHLSLVMQRHVVSQANRQLTKNLVTAVVEYGDRYDAHLRELSGHINILCEHIDSLSEKGGALASELAEIRSQLDGTKEALKDALELKVSYKQQRDDAQRELNGMRRYKADINKRLALQEQRFIESKAELDAYREITSKSEVGQQISNEVKVAARMPPSFEEAMDVLCQKTQEHAFDCSAFIDTISHENDWPNDAYWHHSQFIKDCIRYSRDFYADPARRDLEPARRLIESARALHADVVLTSKISELMPYFGTAIADADEAWKHENHLRDEHFGALSDFCRKACSIAQASYADDPRLREARIELIHAIETLRTIDGQVRAMDIGALLDTPTPQARAAHDVIEAAEEMSRAFDSHEPELSQQIDDLVVSAITVLRRSSPQVFAMTPVHEPQ